MPVASPTSTTQAVGSTAKLQPSAPVADGLNVPLRQDHYGATAPWFDAPTRHQFSEEGSYLVATNPTIGTGLTWVAAQTAFSDTAPNFYIQNPDSIKSLYLDYLQLVATTIATATVAIHYAIKIGTAVRNFTTDNTVTVVPVNPNAGRPNMVNPVIKAQNSATASVLSASSGDSRLVARGTLGGLNIAGTLMLLTFGSTDAGVYAGAADAAGNPGRRGSSAPPVIIPPGGQATIYFWMPSSSASFNPEFELGLIAR